MGCCGVLAGSADQSFATNLWSKIGSHKSRVVKLGTGPPFQQEELALITLLQDLPLVVMELGLKGVP